MGALSTSTNQWLQVMNWGDASKPLSLMDRLFNRMDGAYPHKFRSAFANQQAIQNWREAWSDKFSRAGLSLNEVAEGIDRCTDLYDWPPSLPEFMKACRPSIDCERAFIEAVEQMRKRASGSDSWSSPVVYWAAASLGSDLSNSHYSAISKRWAAALDKASARIKSGELPNEVPARLEALPAPGRQSISEEQAIANIAMLKQMLGASRIGAEA
ncbi:MAG: replication protein P [Gallionella sp.]|nr:replication protein P [Gallionella sp.]